MPVTNVTTITEFVIVGFTSLPPRYDRLVSLLFLLVYLTIVTGNGLFIIIIATERQLQKPTYLIFCYLSVSDLIFGSNILPKAVVIYWTEDRTISFAGCFLQMFLVHFLGAFSSFMLLVMALDRYIAIRNPLRYHALIKNSTILNLSGMSLFIATVRMITILVLSLSLPYCHSNEILNCYCDSSAIIRLGCAHVNEVENVAFAFSVFILFIPLSFITFTYISITVSVMKITRLERRYKIFSTFSSQILIMCVYYIPRCVVYIAKQCNYELSNDSYMAMVMIYTLIPPMVNPLIYCLWTKEIKEIVIKKLSIRKISTIAHNI